MADKFVGEMVQRFIRGSCCDDDGLAARSCRAGEALFDVYVTRGSLFCIACCDIGVLSEV